MAKAKHSVNSILADLQQKKYAPVYFLHGEEPYFIDKISDYIEKNVLPEAEKGFNQVILYGKDVDMAAVLGNAKRFPMMAERQVVIVKEAQEIKDFGKDSGQEQLISYVNNPLLSTVLVLCHKNKKLDARKKIAKELDAKGVLFESKKLYDNEVEPFVSKMIIENGYKINPNASRIFSQYIGNNLSRISNEFEKLTVNLKQGQEIDELTVQRNIGISKEYNIFELQNALIRRDVEKAFRIVNYFAENPKNNPTIANITILFTFFTKVMLVHIHANKQDRELAGIIGVNPYFVKDYRAAARSFSSIKIIDVLKALHEADLQSKGIGYTNISEGDIMKELVYKVLN